MNIAFFMLIPILMSTVSGEELIAPVLELDKNTFQIPLAPKSAELLVCTARLSFSTPNGVNVSDDSYLVQYRDDCPTIVDKIDGFGVSLRLKDLDRDGAVELLAFYSSGAHNFGVKLYRIVNGKIVPFIDQPAMSNMHSVFIRDGEIDVENQKRLSTAEAEIETRRYKIVGDRIDLIASSKRIVSK